jgi:hypothetical protein
MTITTRTIRWATIALVIGFTGSAAAQSGGRGIGRGAGSGAAGAIGSGGRGTSAGWAGSFECVQCTIHFSTSGTWVEFGTEPVVRGMSADGGVLLDGDVIVAVDGILITTSAGGRRFAAIDASEPTRLTVRRNGRQVDVTVPHNVTWAVDRNGKRIFANATDSAMVADREARDSVVRDRRGASLSYSFGRGSDGSVRAIPDPFYLTTNNPPADKGIEFVNVPSMATVRIYTTGGALVRVLQNTDGPGGTVRWDVRNRMNQLVSNGIYMFSVESRGGTTTGRLTIVSRLNAKFDSATRTFRLRAADSSAPPLLGRQIVDSTNRFGRGTRGNIQWKFGQNLEAFDTARNSSRLARDGAAPGKFLGQVEPTGGRLVANDSVDAARAWIGFGLNCRDCYATTDSTGVREWRFPTAPPIAAIDPSGPAKIAGILAGDVLRAIDGISITTAAGGRRFSAIKPGERIRLSLDRRGRTIDVVLTVARVY